MGLLEKLKQVGGGDARDEKRDTSSESSDKPSSGSYESLPGGASGDEAGNATPQRAAELAD